ncbi:GNAT family N-acetyltransferase [Nocardioides pantholopis]|uniref:GNAT family N-acetyltransferase n=1 Tax=Nocardioides pantholopis TaxID=2483798 RepID=UPI000F0973DD|nr:GNAT family N-acetyltransferase [Nocardioides pantholopis]
MTGALAPVLRGERVTLRPWEDGDLNVVLSLASDPLIPLVSEVPNQLGPASARAFIASQRGRCEAGTGWAWAITVGGGPALGYVGALWTAQSAGRASIGYWAHRDSRRSGVTSEAVTAAATWLLSAGNVARLEAYIEPGNVGSIRVAERAGFEREGLMRSFAPVNGVRRDACLYARLPGAQGQRPALRGREQPGRVAEVERHRPGAGE